MQYLCLITLGSRSHFFLIWSLIVSGEAAKARGEAPREKMTKLFRTVSTVYFLSISRQRTSGAEGSVQYNLRKLGLKNTEYIKVLLTIYIFRLALHAGLCLW